MEKHLLKRKYNSIFKTDFGFVTISFLLLGIIRLIGLTTGAEYIVVLGFLIMWILPVIFIKNEKRGKIGIKKPESWLWVFLSFVIGIFGSILIYYIGYLLYGTGAENWVMTVVSDYMADGEALIPGVFAVVTFMMMLFSPIGEELYFRGIIQEVLQERTSSYGRGAFWSSLLFAIIHIPHHGLVFSRTGFVNILLPILLWTIIMFLFSLMFLYARKKSGSVLGAIVCHSGYILGMNLFIYFFLLERL